MADEDPEYIRWIKQQPCHQCASRQGSDPHHKTGAGLAMRSHDHEAFPLCRVCHTAFHAGSVPFKLMVKEDRREWQEFAVRKYRKRHKESKAPGE